MKNRIFSLILLFCLITEMLPISALAAEISSEPFQVYTESEIEEMLNLGDVNGSEDAEMFSFPAEAYGLRRTEAGIEFPILRYGSCEGEAELVLSAMDISATYGKDYTLSVKDSAALKINDDSKQLIATEDKDTPEQILLSEENLAEMETEHGDDDSAADVKDDVTDWTDPAYNIEPDTEIVPSAGNEPDIEITPPTGEPDAEEVPPDGEPDAETVPPEMTGLPQDNKLVSLHDMKEAAFGRETSQTNNFYGGNIQTNTAAFSNEKMREVVSAEVTLHFAAGERYKLVTVHVLPGGTSAGDESLQLILTPLAKTALGDYPTLSVTLKHEGEIEQPIIGFQSTQFTAVDGAADITVVREGGKYTAAVVNFTTTAGSLESGTGYIPTSQAILFMPGETEKTVSVPLLGKAGSFSCLLESPKGAALSCDRATVVVQEPAQGTALYAQNDSIEHWSYKCIQGYESKKYVDRQERRDNLGVFLMENEIYWSSLPDRWAYNIATANREVSGVAYKKVTVNYTSWGEYDSTWDSWLWTWDNRKANTLTTCLWKPNASPKYINTGWKNDVNSEQGKDGIYSRWQHSGDQPRHLTGQSQSVTIPAKGWNDMYTLSFQQQHIKGWLSWGAIHITGIDLEKRQLRFSYLPHEPFIRRIGSLDNTSKVTNIFTISSSTGNNNSRYYIGDTLGWNDAPAAQDKLYEFMTTRGRYNATDYIESSSGSRASLGRRNSISLNDSFFESYGSYFSQDGSTDNKMAYIRPGYDKEQWKCDVTLCTSPDGTAELGFKNGTSIASLTAYPPYLSESITLRAVPNPNLYVKGYRVKYQDYDGSERYYTYELSEKDMKGQGETVELLVPVRYLKMEITPLYTSLSSRKITVTVNDVSREYGVSYPEGVIEEVLDQDGNRTGVELTAGQQITLTAKAAKGYVPVWKRNGVQYCGETYDFEIGVNDTDIKIELSFMKTNKTLSITGTLLEPDIAINELLAVIGETDIPTAPLSGAEISSGISSAYTNSKGEFRLQNLQSVAGTKRTLRIVRDGELFIREITVPASGDVDLGLETLGLPKLLPYCVSGTIRYAKADSQGNLHTYEAPFGGIGSDSSTLFRYDAEASQVNGSVRWFNPNDQIKACQLIFTNREGVEVSRINASRNDYGNFTFSFNPVKDTRAGGGVFLALYDEDSLQYGPYRTGIAVSDPPAGDYELMEGPSVKIPIQDIDLPIVKLSKPNFSSGLFSANMDADGLEIVVGFNVKELYESVSKTIKDAKNNKDAADTVSKEAGKKKEESTKPKAEGVTGEAGAKLKSIEFACTLSFAYFDKDGNPIKNGEYEEGSVLAIYSALFYLGGSGSASLTINASIYGFPVYVELSGKASVAIIARMYAEDESGKKSHFPLTTFNEDPTSLSVEGLVPISVTLGIEAGAGAKKVIAVAVGGETTLDFKWYPWDTGTGTMSFNVYGGLYVLGQALTVNHTFPSIELFDTTRSLFLSSEGEPERTAIDTSRQVIGRDLSFGFTGVHGQTMTVVEGALHDTYPRVADIGNGNYMILFLANRPNSDGVDRTALYYTILSGIEGGNGTASTPALVDNDGTIDAAPDLIDLGDKVLVVWSDAQIDFDADIVSIRDIYSSMDIKGAFYDKTTHTMGAEFSITNDSSGMDMASSSYLPADTQPTICYDEETGAVGVYYLKEDFGERHPGSVESVSDFMNGETTVAFCPIDVSGEQVNRAYWESERMSPQLMEALDGQHLLDVGLTSLDAGLSDPKIESYAAAYRNGYSLYAYPVDLDQSAETTDDQTMFLIVTDLSTGKRTVPVRLTDTPAAITRPRFLRQTLEVAGKTEDRLTLMWESDGALWGYNADDILNLLGDSGDALNLALPEDFSPRCCGSLPAGENTSAHEVYTVAAPDGGIYTVTTGQDGANTEIFVCYYDGKYQWMTSEGEGGSATYLSSEGTWSDLVQVTTAEEDAGQQILLKDAAAAQDGSLLLLYDVFNTGEATGDLRLVRIVPTATLNPEINLEICSDWPKAGETVQVAAEIQSDGLLDNKDVTITFALDKGNGSEDLGAWTGDVPAGGTTRALLDWTVPEDLNADWKLTASATGAYGELAVPIGEMVTLENPDYYYISDDEAESVLGVSVTLGDQGNVSPEALTVKVYSVNREAFFQSMGNDGANIESAYTLLAELPVDAPFEDGNLSVQECVVTLPHSGDGLPRELLIKAVDQNGTEYEGVSRFLTVLDKPESVQMKEKENPNPDPPGGGGGGGNTPTPGKPSVTIGGNGKGGKVTASRDGSVTITPDEGYEIAKITVNGKEVELPEDGKLTGLKRADQVIVTFAPLNTSVPVSQRFVDIKAGAWYEDAVQFAVDNGLFNGTSDTTFSPNGAMTRGMLATVLWRLEGSPTDGKASGFADVAVDAWYAEAVRWATGDGIVEGYGNGTFGPHDPITREQLAAMLWRYAKAIGRDVSEVESTLNFVDAGEASEWAIAALKWAVKQDIVTGKGGGILDPKGQATRTEAAAMLQRFCSSTEK